MSDETGGFIFSADWHLSFNTWGKYPTLAGDAYYSLSQIVSLCIELELPLIAAGDLFDKPFPDAITVNVMRQNMDRMEQAALPVYFIQGQHERVKRSMLANSELSSPCWMNAHSWPQHVHEASFEIGSHKIWGLDWTPADELEDAFSRIPEDRDILVCHQVWQEFMGEHIECEARLDMVPHVQCVFTGDYHETETAAGNDIIMFSPGSISMRSMGEAADKHVYIVKDDGSVSDAELLTRTKLEVTISTEEELESFVAADLQDHAVHIGLSDLSHGAVDCPDGLRKPCLRVNYSDSIPDVYDRVLNKVGDAAYLFLYPRRDESIEIDVEAQERIREQGLLGCLSSVVEEDTPVYESCARLLRTDDLNSELSRMYDDFLSGNSSLPDHGEPHEVDSAGG